MDEAEESDVGMPTDSMIYQLTESQYQDFFAPSRCSVKSLSYGAYCFPA